MKKQTDSNERKGSTVNANKDNNLLNSNVNLKRRAGVRKSNSIDNPSELEVSKELLQPQQDLHKHFSPKINLMELKFPSDSKIRRENQDNRPPSLYIDHIEKKLHTFPGKLEMDSETCKKYFGPDARSQLYDRYKWLEQQRSISLHNPNEELSKLYFEKEKFSPIRSVPFGPSRPMINSESISNHAVENSFRSRFKSKDMTQDESLMLVKSAQRSGVNLDFEMDDFNANEYLSLESENKTSPIKNSLLSFNSKVISKGKPNATEKDVYSDLILDELLKQHNALDCDASFRTQLNSLASENKSNEKLDDIDLLSIGSSSTVSTTGMFLSLFSSEDTSRGEISSPRTKYLAGCIHEKLNPRASLLLRKHLSTQLNLQHLGMGNERARLLAEAISGLPYIKAINVADNMLSDDGIGPIIMASMKLPALIELNLSQNEIGPIAAKVLFDYLVSPNCSLERLILNSADVDDFECSRFIEAVKRNTSLRNLDLSNNKIGNAENLNTVMPDIITGGEAIADLLRSPKCTLHHLKLDWNMIRLDGAKELAQSISYNTTLKFIDLSYNSLSTEGGITLGVSILKNKVLETLILANNSIDSVACFTICAGIVENYSLRQVVMDGNPIGEQGMRSLMLIPTLAGTRVKITAARCNVSIKDTRCWFDFDKIIRDYDLDMENGFERAIVIILLHVVAGHHSYIFSKFVHEVKIKGNSRSRQLDLVQIPSNERVKFFDAKQRAIVDGLERIKCAASDIILAVKLFQEVDKDGSGELDREELGQLMKNIGLSLSEKRLSELMDQYDTDGGGKIELPEFLMMLKAQERDAISRLKGLLETPVMALKSDRSRRFIPPELGHLHITVLDGFAKKASYRIMSSVDRECINEVVEGIGGVSTNMLASSLHATKLRLDEGLSVADSFLADSTDKVAAVRRLIMQMNDFDDARHLIMSVLEGNRSDMLRLKREMGMCLRPILGSPNGYYLLDLSKDVDRLCVEKLLEISTTQAVVRSEASKIGYGRVGDLSQKGNFSSFRNEMLNGEPITITPQFACPLPTSGALEFDFSCISARPAREDPVLSDLRIIRMLLSYFLLDPSEVGAAIYRLQSSKKAVDATLGCDGITHNEVSMDRAKMIGEHVDRFYQNLSVRAGLFTDAMANEIAAAAADENGNQFEFFERDDFSVPFTPTQYIDLMEKKQESERLRREAAKRDAEERARKRAERSYLNFAKPNTSTTIAKPVPNREEMGVPTDSDCEDDQDSLADESSFIESEEDESREVGRRSSMAALKIANGSSAFQANAKGDSSSEDECGGLDDLEMLLLQTKASLAEGSTSSQQAKADGNDSNCARRLNIAHLPYFGLRYLHAHDGDDVLQKLQPLLESPQISSGAKAHRLIEALEEVLGRSWILCRHLALILECFAQFGYIKQTTYFGTYRVDLLVVLFARIVDFYNFELVLEVLSPHEVACVICRLGWLNFYNPCKPEGSWELDLSRREERVLAKTLCVLATHEPGDNWTYQTFRWTKEMESMPGWELTQPWLTEEGMPMRGIVNITYYSGEGKGRHDCKPYVNFRKSLLNLVLIEESEITPDEKRGKTKAGSILPGSKALLKHLPVWESYLAPAFVDPNRKR